jgi:GNAT superfamily N-acetyltransferase
MPGAAELRILVNPGDLDAEVGAAFLTRCFATRWTEAMYRWYLQRSFAGELPDRLILMDGARAVAAVGVVYRQLRTPDGAMHRVGVATAGGTLPGARGRGYYARVLQAVVERSAARGCAALLGFVTAGNTSGRGLTRLGATAIPSAYLVSRNHSPGPQRGTLQLRDAEVADDWPLRAAARLRPPADPAGFHYPDASAWRSQMVDRPGGVQSLRIGATCRAVIERVADTDRLQWLDGDGRERLAAIRAVMARALRHGRKFFMYSTCPHEVSAARRLGLAAHPGYLLVLPLEARYAATVCDWPGMSWRVQSGDRM